MQELQLSPIAPKFVPPQPVEQQVQQQSPTLQMPALTESASKNPEHNANIPQFTAADDLTIQTSVLTAPLSPQFDLNMLVYLQQAGLQHNQQDQRYRHRGQYSKYEAKKANYYASQDKFLGRI